MSRKPGAHLLTRQLEGTFERLGLLRTAGLLAVSGGADSMALLHACARVAGRCGLTLEVATVDHGLRPEAKAEVEGVVRAAAALGLASHPLRIEVGDGPGLEARARTMREEALEQVRRERGLEWIATAHTANDQAETLLMRLGRGAGLRGAAAILERKGVFVRPMLQATRAQVLAVLAEWGVAYAHDPMNDDPAFLRVRVRSTLLPQLEATLGAEAVTHLAEFARIAAEDDAALESFAQDALRRLTLPDGTVDATGVRALIPSLRTRVLVAMLGREGLALSQDRVASFEAALQRGAHVAFTRGVSAHVEGGVIRIVRHDPVELSEYALHPGDPVDDAPSGLRLQLRAQRPADAWALPVPAEALPLQIRRRRPGDRLPLAGGQTAKLQDVLVDAKVPVERRARLPIVVSATGTILAVAGVWPRNPRGPGPWHLVAC